MRLGVKAALAGGELVDGDVDIEDGVIARVGVSPAGSEGVAVPGFVDVHINGIAGVDFLDGRPGRRTAAPARRSRGRAWSPTSRPSSRRTRAPTTSRCAAADAARAEDGGGGLPLVLGVHLEGPFLSPEWPGAHDPEHLRLPDLGARRAACRRRPRDDHDARARAAGRARADRLARGPRRRRLLRPLGRRRRRRRTPPSTAAPAPSRTCTTPTGAGGRATRASPAPRSCART